jgi:hypothetical protein
VTYLSLFATQLSDRYYFLASFPYYSTCGQAASDHQKLGSMMPGAKGIFVLSLDKRFDGKQHYAYPAAVIRVNPPLPVYEEYVEGGHKDILYTPHISATQRGPPIQA